MKRIVSLLLCLAMLLCALTAVCAEDVCVHGNTAWTDEVAPQVGERGLQAKRCAECGTALEWRITDPVYDGEFTDIDESRWYMDAVKFAVSNDIFKGITESEFAPDGTMTRAMAVTVLYRIGGTSFIPTSKVFSDVQEGSWYHSAVRWASSEYVNIVKGVDDDRFDPEGYVTREQFATILYRYANYYNADTTARADLSVYNDAHEISAYAEDAISWAVAKGIIKGVSEGTLSPKGYCTRAQAAELMRLFSDNLYERSTPKLIVDGNDISEGNCIAIDYLNRYALLPVEEVLSALGFEYSWENEHLLRLYDGPLYLDTVTGKVGFVSPDGNVHDDFFEIDGGRIRRKCIIVDGQLIIDSNTMYMILKEKKVITTVDYVNSIVLVDRR